MYPFIPQLATDPRQYLAQTYGLGQVGVSPIAPTILEESLRGYTPDLLSRTITPQAFHGATAGFGPTAGFGLPGVSPYQFGGMQGVNPFLLQTLAQAYQTPTPFAGTTGFGPYPFQTGMQAYGFGSQVNPFVLQSLIPQLLWATQAISPLLATAALQGAINPFAIQQAINPYAIQAVNPFVTQAFGQTGIPPFLGAGMGLSPLQTHAFGRLGTEALGGIINPLVNPWAAHSPLTPWTVNPVLQQIHPLAGISPYVQAVNPFVSAVLRSVTPQAGISALG